MGIEGEPIETPEVGQEPPVNGEEDQEEVMPDEPLEADDEREAEMMARQVPPEITEGMLGGWGIKKYKLNTIFWPLYKL